jgi:hypothetical protein
MELLTKTKLASFVKIDRLDAIKIRRNRIRLDFFRLSIFRVEISI